MILINNYCTIALRTPSSPSFILVTVLTNMLTGPSGSGTTAAAPLVLLVAVFVVFVVVFVVVVVVSVFLLPVLLPLKLLLFWYPPTAAVSFTLLFGELLPVAVGFLLADAAVVDSKEEAGVRRLPEKPATEE